MLLLPRAVDLGNARDDGSWTSFMLVHHRDCSGSAVVGACGIRKRLYSPFTSQQERCPSHSTCSVFLLVFCFLISSLLIVVEAMAHFQEPYHSLLTQGIICA